MKTGAEESEEHAAMSSNKVVFRTTRFLGNRDLWPAEEEETEHGLYLRLKDGTRLLATGSLAETPREATNAAQEGNDRD
jgi:hypothetical protein